MSINIKYIMEKFDFEKIHAYMVLTNWRYRNNDKSPSIEELKITACSVIDKCLIEVYKDDNIYHFCSFGGFKASYYPKEKNIELSFIIEIISNRFDYF